MNDVVEVTEMKTDGSVETTYVPAEQFDAAEYIPSEVEGGKTGISTVIVGAAAVTGVCTAIYGAYKGIKKLRRIYKAGVEALAAEEDIVEADLGEKVEDASVREFVDKRKEENASKSDK